MARQSMVTRTITTTNVVAMVVNTEKGETEVKEFALPRTYKDNAAILKYCAKHIDNDTTKVVKIIEATVKEQLYGMTEQDFIGHAKPIEK
jgi:hypothetical protein